MKLELSNCRTLVAMVELLELQSNVSVPVRIQILKSGSTRDTSVGV